MRIGGAMILNGELDLQLQCVKVVEKRRREMLIVLHHKLRTQNYCSSVTEDTNILISEHTAFHDYLERTCNFTGTNPLITAPDVHLTSKSTCSDGNKLLWRYKRFHKKCLRLQYL